MACNKHNDSDLIRILQEFDVDNEFLDDFETDEESSSSESSIHSDGDNEIEIDAGLEEENDVNKEVPKNTNLWQVL